MIRHIMKDGSERDSIEGILLKKEDFPTLYAILSKIEVKDEKKTCNNRRSDRGAQKA